MHTARRTRPTSHAVTHATPPRRTRGATALIGMLALVLAACGGGTSEEPTDAATPTPAPVPAPAPTPTVEPLSIVVTTAILGDVVAQLVGDDADVRVLMAPGIDPHGYEASAADAAAMRDADLVIANGLLLEEGLLSALSAASDDGVRIVELAPALDPIPFEGEHDHAHDDDHDHAHDDDHDHDHAHDDDHDHDHAHEDEKAEDDHAHDHGEEDPHFWFDPLRMAGAVDLLAAELAEVRPEIDWSARATPIRTELEALDAELTALFATIPTERRKLITNHDSLGYLADRYGFEVIGTVVPGASTTVETNPRAFAELVEVLVAERLDVIFAETTDSTNLADALASEAIDRSDLDVRVVQIYTGSLGEPGSGAETYVGMLRTTAQLITDALAG